MGEAVLADFPEVEEISLSLPNKHCLLVNLEPFGMDNPNEVFLPVDEPHGLIEATLCRGNHEKTRFVFVCRGIALCGPTT